MENLSTRTVEDSADFLAEIVGEESRAGERMQAGPILKLMYNTAYAVAWRHAGHRPVLLGIDRMDLTQVICHMDLVRLEGRLVEVGRSSMVIEIRVLYRRPMEVEFNTAHVGFITMVAVDDDRTPVRDIPRLSHDSPQGPEVKALAAHRRAQLLERRQAIDWIGQSKALRVEDVVEPEQCTRQAYLRPEETLVQVKAQIVSPGVRDGRVRAGDVMLWLDRVATYTARQFTRSNHVVTVSLNDVLFTRPLHDTDHIEMRARVIHVRTHTLEVSIDMTVHPLEGAPYDLESVDFSILNYHSSGLKQKIATGLLLDNDDTENLRRYLRARTRHAFWKQNPESHLTQIA